MRIIKLLIFLIFAFLYACAGYEKNRTSKDVDKIYYSSSGFALIYEESLYKDKTINKKINNDELIVLHSLLKKNTPIRITNLSNSKYIDSKIYNKAKFPKIFNVLISKRIASILELDNENPLVEINELKKNEKFVAKEGSIFDEERNVADKAPVDAVVMDDITKTETQKVVEKTKKNNFILVISDFYYEDSAIDLKKDLIKKVKLDNIYIKKINNNKYRLLVGPFKNFNALKTTYISLNNLGFESLNIYNE